MNPVVVMLGLLAAMPIVHWLMHDAASQAIGMGALIALAFIISSPTNDMTALARAAAGSV